MCDVAFEVLHFPDPVYKTRTRWVRMAKGSLFPIGWKRVQGIFGERLERLNREERAQERQTSNATLATATSRRANFTFQILELDERFVS